MPRTQSEFKFGAHERVHAQGAPACESRRGTWTFERTSRISCSKRALLTSGCIGGMLWDRAEGSKRIQPRNRVSGEFVCLSSKKFHVVGMLFCLQRRSPTKLEVLPHFVFLPGSTPSTSTSTSTHKPAGTLTHHTDTRLCMYVCVCMCVCVCVRACVCVRLCVCV